MTRGMAMKRGRPTQPKPMTPREAGEIAESALDYFMLRHGVASYRLAKVSGIERTRIVLMRQNRWPQDEYVWNCIVEWLRELTGVLCHVGDFVDPKDVKPLAMIHRHVLTRDLQTFETQR